MATTTINHGVDFVLNGEHLQLFSTIPQADAIGEIYAEARRAHAELSAAFQKTVSKDGYASAILKYGDSLATADHRVYVCELAIEKSVELLKLHYPSGVVEELIAWLGDLLFGVASEQDRNAEDRSRHVRAICDVKQCFDSISSDNRYVGRNAKWF